MSPPEPSGSDQQRVRKINAAGFKEGTDPAAESHTTAEGSESVGQDDLGRTGRLGTLQQMALATDPDTPLADVDSPWNPEEGGLSRVYRGFQKVAGFDGMPAVLDIGIGVGEFLHTYQLEGAPAESGDQETGPSNGGEGGDTITEMATSDE